MNVGPRAIEAFIDYLEQKTEMRRYMAAHISGKPGQLRLESKNLGIGAEQIISAEVFTHDSCLHECCSRQ